MKERLLNIVTVIQARMGSTRLPGKIMYEAAGKPLLLHMYERVRSSKLAGTIVIATTNEPEDNVIEELCEKNGINCLRGSTNDLLERHYKVAIAYSADVIIKIPSDCPLIDPAIIDKTIDFYIRNRNTYDYVSNLHPQSYPDGNDVEVFSFNALYKAYKNANKEYEREHTTPYIWNNPGKFSIGNVECGIGIDLSLIHRFVLDYYEDLKLITTIYEKLYPVDPYFNLEDILDLLNVEPSISEINSHLKGISWYKNYENELNQGNMRLLYQLN